LLDTRSLIERLISSAATIQSTFAAILQILHLQMQDFSQQDLTEWWQHWTKFD